MLGKLIKSRTRRQSRSCYELKDVLAGWEQGSARGIAEHGCLTLPEATDGGPQRRTAGRQEVQSLLRPLPIRRCPIRSILEIEVTSSNSSPEE